ncbi:hypothetical protein Tco_0576848, partial [Tanacetum coccineum]
VLITSGSDPAGIVGAVGGVGVVVTKWEEGAGWDGGWGGGAGRWGGGVLVERLLGEVEQGEVVLGGGGDGRYGIVWVEGSSSGTFCRGECAVWGFWRVVGVGWSGNGWLEVGGWGGGVRWGCGGGREILDFVIGGLMMVREFGREVGWGYSARSG